MLACVCKSSSLYHLPWSLHFSVPRYTHSPTEYNTALYKWEKRFLILFRESISWHTLASLPFCLALVTGLLWSGKMKGFFPQWKSRQISWITFVLYSLLSWRLKNIATKRPSFGVLFSSRGDSVTGSLYTESFWSNLGKERKKKKSATTITSSNDSLPSGSEQFLYCILWFDLLAVASSRQVPQ